jgi:hypothetical protein
VKAGPAAVRAPHGVPALQLRPRGPVPVALRPGYRLARALCAAAGHPQRDAGGPLSGRFAKRPAFVRGMRRRAEQEEADTGRRITRRRTEEEGVDALFRPRVTTKSAGWSVTRATRSVASNTVPRRGVEPLCPCEQTGLSRPRIPFRHPGWGSRCHSAPGYDTTRPEILCHTTEIAESSGRSSSLPAPGPPLRDRTIRQAPDTSACPPESKFRVTQPR